ATSSSFSAPAAIQSARTRAPASSLAAPAAGQSATVQPLNSAGFAAAKPRYSVPAIGCAPTNATRSCLAPASQTRSFAPHTSVRTEPGAIRAATWGSIARSGWAGVQSTTMRQPSSGASSSELPASIAPAPSACSRACASMSMPRMRTSGRDRRSASEREPPMRPSPTIAICSMASFYTTSARQAPAAKRRARCMTDRRLRNFANRGRAMRLGLAGVVAIVIGCGGQHQAQPPPSENKGPPPAPEQVTLAITTSGDGAVHGDVDCRGACTKRFDKGTKVSLTAVPDSGAVFAGWGGACSGDPCALTLDADAAVVAAFTRPKPQHRVAVFLDGHGSVRSVPSGIDCGASCNAAFDEGTQVALTPAPDSGYAFSRWGGACNGAGGCAVTIRGDVNVSAKFDPLPPQMFAVTLSVTGPGRVTGSGLDCPGSVCSVQVSSGTALALTAAPNAGARFMGWSGCSGSCSMTGAQNVSIGARLENERIAL